MASIYKKVAERVGNYFLFILGNKDKVLLCFEDDEALLLTLATKIMLYQHLTRNTVKGASMLLCTQKHQEKLVWAFSCLSDFHL